MEENWSGKYLYLLPTYPKLLHWLLPFIPFKLNLDDGSSHWLKMAFLHDSSWPAFVKHSWPLALAVAFGKTQSKTFLVPPPPPRLRPAMTKHWKGPNLASYLKHWTGECYFLLWAKNKLLLGVILKDAIVVKAFQQTSDSSLVANQFFNQARPLSFLLNNASVMLAKYTRQVVLPS